MNVQELRQAWIDERAKMDEVLSEAAILYADQKASLPLIGGGITEWTEIESEFECAVVKRNQAIIKAADKLIIQADVSVHELECWQQYQDGLIAGYEMLNWIAVHGDKHKSNS